MNRRGLLQGILLGATALPLFGVALATPAPSDPRNVDAAAARLAALERQHGGTLGVAILDTSSGRQVAHRADERFLMCSTFKLVAVAAVLARVDQGREQLDRRIIFGKNVLLNWAPTTTHRVGAPGMTVRELCEAAITVSDNTAANLLLASLGGPAAVTAFVRTLGDPLTRLDRTEPELNVGSPGDLRDTTTPAAMLADLQVLLLGNALSVASRGQLIEWLCGNTTGNEQLRAGVPAGWRVGDKTGSGAQHEANDIGILWPPQRKPLLVTAYYKGSTAGADGRHAVLAAVGRIAASIAVLPSGR
ncbi:class A beta-lactamase [Rhodanobacter sp. AS-Z3]|uniref:class A beta-lactamase n=1 Tax=Rhodanobacter sp. AS-Z3 TaxID=3031330 RepID=UPI0024793CE1|nr:class A beta-lactamase [Rhodanobacter sp. AS-Z3]WEN13559.1 class A beta-lactamase [Rhodanobacter sp. AS-Z3]